MPVYIPVRGPVVDKNGELTPLAVKNWPLVEGLQGGLWVEFDGVSPNRTASIKTLDGSDIITIAIVTY